MILPVLTSLILFIADKISKSMALDLLGGGEFISVIKNLFSFVLVKNTGAAWGLFKGNEIILLGLTSIMIIVLVLLLISRKVDHILANWSLCLVIAGGLGNLTDRFMHGYVVDFIKFMPFNFPVFNIADICVVAGTILFAIYVFFFDDNLGMSKSKKDSKLTEEVLRESNEE